MQDSLVLLALLGPLGVLGLLALLVQMVRWDLKVRRAMRALPDQLARKV